MRYSVRYTHKISSSPNDRGPDVLLLALDITSRTALGAALRKQGALSDGASIREFRREPDGRIVAFPRKPGSTTYWHAIVMTPVDSVDASWKPGPGRDPVYEVGAVGLHGARVEYRGTNRAFARKTYAYLLGSATLRVGPDNVFFRVDGDEQRPKVVSMLDGDARSNMSHDLHRRRERTLRY